MCLVKTPKVTQQAAAQDKKVQVFTNRYFTDRGEDALSARIGRNALKITRGSRSPSGPSTGVILPNTSPNPLAGIPTVPSGSSGGGRTGLNIRLQ